MALASGPGPGQLPATESLPSQRDGSRRRRSGDRARPGLGVRKGRHARKLGGARGRSNGVATGTGAREIPRVSQPSIGAQPPYALAIPVFRHRALAALAARAPMGPAREVTLAWYLCARLIDGATGAQRLSPSVRHARAASARSWLSTAGLPTSCRMTLGKLMDACGSEGEPDRQRIARAAADALGATAEHLDPSARAEVELLARP
jgi:hypothetical protein